MKIKLWNYRNININYPIELKIQEGVTFILGINNAGKSNILKFFYDLRHVFGNLLINNDKIQFHVNTSIFLDEIINRNNNLPFVKIEITNEYYFLKFKIKPYLGHEKHTNTWLIEGDINEEYINNSNYHSFIKEVKELFASFIYVPSNRVDFGNAGNNYDLLMGNSFIGQWNNWANGRNAEKREKIQILISELGELFNVQNFNITVNDDRSSLLIRFDGKDYLLNSVGSGISQFIFVLGNVLFKQPNLILIDEPEISLHPKLQITFVRLLSKRCKALIASTHSIGLARSTGDFIYSLTLQNNAPRLSLYGEHYEPTLAQSLSEMSYSQYVDIGGNNILLVEGRTDVKSYREILRKYNIEHKFIIFSIGGGNFIVNNPGLIAEELKELTRFNANSISMIVDSHRISANDKISKELISLEKVCRELNISLFITCRHSTENYISQAAIDEIVGNGILVLGKYENFNKRTNEDTWDKNLNWKMFEKMKQSDFNGTELDEFINSTLCNF
ncbi:MAG: AAA family ATPase [Saprospiraceae bacterium]|nr:AAA family ATPase [Saprospiraceae bacterium]